MTDTPTNPSEPPTIIESACTLIKECLGNQGEELDGILQDLTAVNITGAEQRCTRLYKTIGHIGAAVELLAAVREGRPREEMPRLTACAVAHRAANIQEAAILLRSQLAERGIGLPLAARIFAEVQALRKLLGPEPHRDGELTETQQRRSLVVHLDYIDAWANRIQTQWNLGRLSQQDCTLCLQYIRDHVKEIGNAFDVKE